MGFHYAFEKKRFDLEWKKKERWYKEEGMEESAITQMYGFDLEVFNRERAFVNHTQEYPDESPNDSGHGSTLFRKFECLSTRFSTADFSGRYDWIEDLDDSSLVTVLKKLSQEELELLTLKVFEGYSFTDIAKKWGISRQAVSQRFGRIRKYFVKL